MIKVNTIRQILLTVGLVFALSRVPAQQAVGPGSDGLATMTGSDVSQLNSLSDEQLQAFLSLLVATPTLPPEALPRQGRVGNFYSLQHENWPPFPGDVNSNNVWAGNGMYLLDDLGFDYRAADRAHRHARRKPADGSALATGLAASAADDTGGGLPMPPGGGYGDDDLTNSDGPTITLPDYGTNLWLAQVNVSSNNLLAIASNTIADVQYEIQSWTDLTQPANWVSQGFILGSETTNWTPLTPLPVSLTNNFFIGLRSWASTDGSGLPSWWEAEYFGTNAVNPNAQDSAGDGWTICQKFALGVPPNSFITPPAPQGINIVFNTNNQATVSWQPAPGLVTSYTVTIYDGQTYQTTTFTTNATSFVENLSADSANAFAGGYPQFNVQYSIVANYGTNGSSALGSASLEDLSAQVPAVFNGPQGDICMALTGLPADLCFVKVYRHSEGTLWSYGFNDLDDGAFVLPANNITNGILQIPASEALPYGAYYFAVQTSRSNGLASDWSGMSLGCQYLPFLDERPQLKDNLRFTLRAASDVGPLKFNYYPKIYGSIYSSPTNCVYSDFYSDIYDGNYIAFDALDPIFDNYVFRNFVFAQTNLNADGTLDTGAFYDEAVDSDNDSELYLSTSPLYVYNLGGYITATNPVAPPSLLAANQANWIMSPHDYEEIIAGQCNYYGLPYLSVEDAFNSNNQLITVAYNPGDSMPIGHPYYQVAQPLFQNSGYYFARPDTDPMPEQSGFSQTNTTPLMIQAVGQPLTVAGYAQLAIQNSTLNVPCYLGQYFQQACQIDANGNVTSNPTGILSPYGNFTATQPGPAALVTMPDIDTGAQGTCTVYAVSLQLDANHDGNMDLSFNGADATSWVAPMVFWCNNNFDRWATNKSLFGLVFTDVEQDDQQIAGCPLTPSTPTPDCNYKNRYGVRIIPDTRDLEDFARLWVCGVTSNLLAALPAGSTITLNWGDVGNTNSSNPTIDVFQAVDPDGGMDYLTNETVAAEQIDTTYAAYVGRVAPGGSVQLNSSAFGGWAGNHFIWCGVSNGIGGLNLTIADGNGNVLAQTTAYIQILDIKQMYERWTVGDNAIDAPTNVPYLVTVGLPAGASAFQYPSPPAPGTPYILHVHGYNMQTWEKDRFAETEYKRLYWQGYQGRFGEFRWPTTVQGYVNATTAFNDSEYNAWRSAPGLLNLLTSLNSKYPGQVYLTAHSHGNVVAGEALRLAGNNQVVNTYIAMQGAVAAHAYDPTTLDRYSPLYPDYYAQYWTSGAPCYFNDSAGAGTYVNFFNTNDWALTGLWPTDQDEKPASGFGFESDGVRTNFFVGTLESNNPLLPPSGSYLIFSYCDPAPCFALGAQMDVGGAFLNVSGYNQVTLPSVWPPDTATPTQPYSTHIWHSAEFRSDNAQRWLFWDMALFQMGIKRGL